MNNKQGIIHKVIIQNMFNNFVATSYHDVNWMCGHVDWSSQPPEHMGTPKAECANQLITTPSLRPPWLGAWISWWLPAMGVPGAPQQLGALSADLGSQPQELAACRCEGSQESGSWAAPVPPIWHNGIWCSICNAQVAFQGEKVQLWGIKHQISSHLWLSARGHSVQGFLTSFKPEHFIENYQSYYTFTELSEAFAWINSNVLFLRYIRQVT